jgi:hypothetical protein
LNKFHSFKACVGFFSIEEQLFTVYFTGFPIEAKSQKTFDILSFEARTKKSAHVAHTSPTGCAQRASLSLWFHTP